MNLKKNYISTLLLSIALLTGCATLPENVPKKVSHSRHSPNPSILISNSDRIASQIPGKSAVSLLRNGMDAFLARALLIKAANDSLDLQYYIWRNDTTGKILTLLLLEAADRGVRVRLLLDDLNTQDNDPALLALNQHPNFEVRLYNPFAHRTNRFWNLLTDFKRLNHRMHNKLFITDSKIAIVGGRNIGDEYFQASSTLEFNDADAMTLGPVIDQAGHSFDHYWNSAIVYPVDTVALNTHSIDINDLREQLQKFRNEQTDSEYAKALKKSQLIENLLNRDVDWYWGNAALLYDRIEKQAHQKDASKIIGKKLAEELNNISHELIIISPYFVPGETLLALLSKLRDRGVDIHILTNSLASTDVPMVHAGYQKYRKQLLRMGIHLYESKPSVETADKKDFVRFTSSARNSLHAKSYLFDKKKLFISSLNLDPRSIHINTEVGLLFENSILSSQISDTFKIALKDYAYQLKLQNSTSDLQPVEKIIWIDENTEGTREYINEPGIGTLQSFSIFLLSLLPIEEQL